MISFDCKHVLDVPDHMKDACWKGYILDLLTVPAGSYARLIFVYPDIEVLDVRVMLKIDEDRYTTVSLLNLKRCFWIRNVHYIEENAKIAYDIDLNINVASGIAIAIDAISKLFECKNWEKHENIAEYGDLSMTVLEIVEMVQNGCVPQEDEPF